MPEGPYQVMRFPVAGIDVLGPFCRQSTREVQPRVYARSTPEAMNVRGYEATADRRRGGSRSGLSKYITSRPVAGWVLQELAVVVASLGSDAVQLSQSGRAVTLVAVNQGNVYALRAGGDAWLTTTNTTGDSPPLNFTGTMQSASNGQKLWFADGTNWVYFDPADLTVNRWQPTAGLLPVDSEGNTPRLIETWRGRTVLSGLLYDPQNWFMSRVNDPLDFDYAPEEPGPDQAVSGNSAPMGLIGDVVNTFIPYSDDLLVVGGDATISVFSGDPMAGGQIDFISHEIGMAWGKPWCRDPFGTIYFFSNRPAVYSLVPGQRPVRISQAIDNLMQDIDTGTNTIRLLWNDRQQGFHVFITPTTAPAETTHYFYELRTGAWWQDQFAHKNLNPLTCCTFDGNLPDDRVALIGSWDGYVRAINPDATTDDGRPFTSTVTIGPLLSKDMDDMLLREVQALLGADSGDVNWSVHVGQTPEAALASTAVASGTWTNGRNLSNYCRWAGYAIYIKITSSNAWQMEQLRCLVEPLGKVRRRGR